MPTLRRGAAAIEVHPAADLFPLLPEAELQELAKDIGEHGQREPIDLIIYQGQASILDGRNRWLACQIADVEPATRFWVSPESATAYVLSKNLRRRHLSAEQRAALAVSVLPLFEAEAKERMAEGGARGGRGKGSTDSVHPLPEANQPAGRAIAQAAKATGASRDTAQRLKSAADKAPEVLPLALGAEINVSQAQAIAAAPEEERPALIERARAGEPATALRPADAAAPPAPAAGLFGDALSEELAALPRTPPRTASPAAETLVQDKEDDDAQEDAGALSLVPQDAPAAVAPGTDPQPRGVPVPADAAPGPSGDAGAQVRPTSGGAGARGAAAKPGEPYDPTERLSLLRHAPCLKDVPEAERPAVAAALRQLAATLDPTRDEDGEEAMQAELLRLQARVRELEAVLAMARERGDNMEERWGEAESRAAEAERKAQETAARRGYEAGQVETLAWAADLLGDTPEEGATAEELREQVEARALELKEFANGGGAGVAEGLQQEIGTLRRELKMEQDAPCGDCELARERIRDLERDLAGAIRDRLKVADSEAAPGLFVDSEEPTEPAQAELTYEREEQLRPGAAKKPKAKAPKVAAPASRWRTGDQVLIDTRKGTRRATAICVPDGLFVVLRADPTKKLKADLYKTKVADGHLRHDPATTPEDRTAGIREAVDVLEDTPGTPPADWIEALKAALS